MSEETETKTRKKTEHTRIVAQLCSLMNEIFTSVVVYSRTSQKQHEPTQTSCLTKQLRLGSRVEKIDITTSCLESYQRKKTEHTRMYAQLCSSANEIFTSVVVYSRTSKNKQTQKTIRGL